MNRSKRRDPNDLLSVPGVGPKTAADLMGLGIRSTADLRGKDPERLYADLCRRTGTKVDRCMLYVFRSAVYYASTDNHDPALLKWWNWSDIRISGRSHQDGS